MGVPSLFRWLARKYPATVQQISKEDHVDNLYLDLNGIIHPCCHPINKPAPKTEAEMFREIFKCIDHLVQITSPRQLLYIAVDGVAPRAKMNQQRERRFKAALAREKEGAAQAAGGDAEAAGGTEEDEDAEIEKDLMEIGFDSNCITPGTVFMMKLHASIVSYIEERLSANPSWRDLTVIYSGCDVPGEGEHKIYNFVRKQRESGRSTTTRHVICGLDADLIFLSLATHEKYFRILREDVFWLEEQMRSKCTVCKAEGHSAGNCVPPAFPPYLYLSITALRDYLASEFARAVGSGGSLERLIDDWIFICFFVGNDFLPSIPCLDIRVQAIETLTNIYLSLFYHKRAYLTSGADINYRELSNFLFELAKEEKALLHAKYSNYVKTVSRRNQKVREEDERIRLYEDRGREKYYAVKLGASTSKEVNLVCREYVEGLAWVLRYYQASCPSWSWYYPRHFAPYAADISLVSSFSPSFKEDAPCRPLEQVMAVLPAGSRNSIPPAFFSIFSEMPEFYPQDVKIDHFGKTQEWQGVAILPFINNGLLARCVQQKMEKLSLDEVYRNVEGRDLIFLSQLNKNYPQLEVVYSLFKAAADLEDAYCAGRLFPFAHAKLPGSGGRVAEENRSYLVKSLCAAYVPGAAAPSSGSSK